MSTAIVPQQSALAQAQEAQDNSPMALISRALNSGMSPDVIRELVNLQQSMERFEWEKAERQATIDFDDALNRCQDRVTTIIARRDGDGGKYKYANYDDLDQMVRPIYTSEGFSISYGEADCPTQGKTRMVAFLRRSGITREYFKDLTASVLGPKGTPVMTQINAEGSLDSYGRRFLLRDIFNIAIGKDDDDGKGGMPSWLVDHINGIEEASDPETLRTRFQEAYKVAQKIGDRKAMGELMFRHDKKKSALKAVTA